MRKDMKLGGKAAAITVTMFAAVALNVAPALACGSVALQHRNENSFKHTQSVVEPEHREQHATNKQEKQDHKKAQAQTTQTNTQNNTGTDDKQYLHRSNKLAGDNGTVKVHKVTTSTTDIRNNPKVCEFYLDAFQFDGQQSVDWYIVKHTHGAKVLDGSIVLNDGGHGYTDNYNLPNGMYKLYWNFDGEHGSAKHKVFKVQCGEVQGEDTETPSSTTPEKGGKGGGHILAAHTTTPSVKGELVNTGTSPIISTIFASLLVGVAGVVAFARKSRQAASFDDIAL